jgi:hypothetical protein
MDILLVLYYIGRFSPVFFYGRTFGREGSSFLKRMRTFCRILFLAGCVYLFFMLAVLA